MQKSELIEKILEENNGILRLEDALLAGISKTYALDFIKKSITKSVELKTLKVLIYKGILAFYTI